MAKKKESKYQTWEEVNEAMKRLAELNIEKKSLETEQNRQIDEIKKATSLKADEVIKEIKSVEKDIIRFAEQNRAEFTRKRTKVLTFGKISFRYTKSIGCANIPTAIKALKSFAMEKYLRIKEELNKEALIEADPMILGKCGILIKAEDKICVEPDYVKLASLDTDDIPY